MADVPPWRGGSAVFAFEEAAQHCMHPTGPIGPRCIGAFAYVGGLVAK
jgi:hypothetical protein